MQQYKIPIGTMHVSAHTKMTGGKTAQKETLPCLLSDAQRCKQCKLQQAGQLRGYPTCWAANRCCFS